MTSTFHGLETAKRALTAQQAALYTTGHNIANANTKGYTRQRVNLQTTNPYPAPGFDQPKIAGQIGTGVKADEVQRIRDSFTDMQYRTETSKLGYWQAKAEMISQMEGIMNEPSDTGLSAIMDQFWNALQDLAVQPQNDGARRVVRERGITLASTFNYISNSLKAVQTDYRKEIDATQDRINSILRQINSINKQIQSIEPHGYLPNDLYDERDRLVDELSEMVNIRIETKPSGGLASASAVGMYDIYLATPTGDILKDSNNKAIKLVDSSMGVATGIHIQYDNRAQLDSPVTAIKFFRMKDNEPGFDGLKNELEADQAANPTFIINEFSKFNNQGSLAGFIEGYGYLEADGTIKGTYNDMLADLDIMAFTFAQEFNKVHSNGWSLHEIANNEHSEEYGSFFSFGALDVTSGNIRGAAANIQVAKHIIDDVQHIAAAKTKTAIDTTMKPADAGYTGNHPVLKGVYDPENVGVTVVDSTGNEVEWPALATEVNVKVTSGPPWDVAFTAEYNGETYTATYSSDQIIFNVFGIEFNVGKVNAPPGSEWSFSFNVEAYVGDGANALALADVKDKAANYGGTETNVQSFYQGMIGKLGDNASEANRMQETATVLRSSVEERRLSESSVSLDEEMVNMIMFQHAYNAAARQITLIDEMLDRIINNMGVVGR